jgi:hypothetical protein
VQCTNIGGTWQPAMRCTEFGVCSGAIGSCCLPSGICRDTSGSGGEPAITPSGCLNLGGIWQSNVLCNTRNCTPAPLGACCLPGDCFQATNANCDISGGVWHLGASCSEPGLCDVPCGCQYNCQYNDALNSWTWVLSAASRCGTGECPGSCNFPQTPCIAGTAQSAYVPCVD